MFTSPDQNFASSPIINIPALSRNRNKVSLQEVGRKIFEKRNQEILNECKNTQKENLESVLKNAAYVIDRKKQKEGKKKVLQEFAATLRRDLFNAYLTEITNYSLLLDKTFLEANLENISEGITNIINNLSDQRILKESLITSNPSAEIREVYSNINSFTEGALTAINIFFEDSYEIFTEKVSAAKKKAIADFKTYLKTKKNKDISKNVRKKVLKTMQREKSIDAENKKAIIKEAMSLSPFKKNRSETLFQYTVSKFTESAIKRFQDKDTSFIQEVALAESIIFYTLLETLNTANLLPYNEELFQNIINTNVK